MGDVLSGILGTDSSVQTQNQDPYRWLQRYDWSGAIDQGRGQANQTFANQNALANILNQQVQGGGPNPAQAMLQQQTAENAQQAAQAYAGNRAVNAGLAARNASNMQANVNQKAVGQAAIMRAQQQLAAQQQLQGLYGQQGQQAVQMANVGAQGLGGQNQAYNAASGVNAGVAAGNQQAAQGIIGGIMQGAGAAIGAAHGGMIPGYATGEMVAPSGGGSFPQIEELAGNLNESLSQVDSSRPKQPGKKYVDFGNPTASLNEFIGLARMFGGGSVPQSYAQRKLSSGGAINFVGGGHVPGSAKVNGDSPKNDVVPAMLSPGEIVLPRSVVDSPDPQAKAAQFVAAVLGKRGLSK